MSAHSKPPYITPSMDVSSVKGVAWGRRGQQLEFASAHVINVFNQRNRSRSGNGHGNGSMAWYGMVW